jgi:hypothetical protein
MYRELDVQQVVATAAILERRIQERFPSSGLGKVASELHQVAREAGDVAHWLARPIRWLRLLTLGMALVLVAGLVAGLSMIQLDLAAKNLGELAQAVEALVNDVVFLGIGIYFLVNLENRIKRKRVLAALHVLRSIAHIVDMHQLTKDPERLLHPGPDTASSPKREMNTFELARYLDYASELLAITSKVGAIYVQHFDDTDSVEAASDVESLTVGLSRKVWQKIVLLERVSAATPST